VLFQTPLFFAFFAIVLVLLVLLRTPRQRQWLLLLASFAFYASWDWRFLSLLWISTAVDYAVGLALPRRPERGRALVTLSVVTNLGILGAFKYFDFFADSAAELMGALGVTLHPTTLDVVLPIGISFYTFQSMSYTIDVHRGAISPERSLLRFALYVAFFPQLVAGPIVRAGHFLPQLDGPCRPRARDFAPGALLFAVGLFKKVALSDHVGLFSDRVFAEHATLSPAFVGLGVLCYAFQIYLDFSGYSDMAIGAGRILGFRLPRNFDLPYRASSPRDFWRRWHISLSTWLRDYLYVSLGGNRGSRARTMANGFVTMLLGGLWHGASFNFVLWGAWHGLWIALSRFVERLPAALAWAITFVAVLLGWVLFRSVGLSHALSMTRALVGLGGPVLPPVDLPLAAAVAALTIAGFAHTRLGIRAGSWAWRRSALARSAMAGSLIVAAFILAQGHTRPFIYFQF
jgi:alginate O-acetyltransferase complex protein AlgI